MKQLLAGLRHFADGVAAAMLAAMFSIFLVQIASRYLFNIPMGWTIEVCLTLWLWVVFWGGAFCMRASDHIRFDILYLSVNRPTQRIFSVIAALAIVMSFAISFLPTVDYVWFYRIKPSATLHIPLHYVFGIYLVFMIMIMLRYGRILIDFARGKEDLEGKIVAFDMVDRNDAP
jgi:C4-dicarboxylate transporter, DctQ subunit